MEKIRVNVLCTPYLTAYRPRPRDAWYLITFPEEEINPKELAETLPRGTLRTELMASVFNRLKFIEKTKIRELRAADNLRVHLIFVDATSFKRALNLYLGKV